MEQFVVGVGVSLLEGHEKIKRSRRKVLYNLKFMNKQKQQ